MKIILPIIATMLLTFSAHASSWTCASKKLSVVLEETQWGLVLAAEYEHETILGTQVSDDDVHFNMGKQTLRNIKAVGIENQNISTGLNINEGAFYFSNGRRLISEENLKCKFGK